MNSMIIANVIVHKYSKANLPTSILYMHNWTFISTLLALEPGLTGAAFEPKDFDDF